MVSRVRESHLAGSRQVTDQVIMLAGSVTSSPGRSPWKGKCAFAKWLPPRYGFRHGSGVAEGELSIDIQLVLPDTQPVSGWLGQVHVWGTARPLHGGGCGVCWKGDVRRYRMVRTNAKAHARTAVFVRMDIHTTAVSVG